MSYNVTRVTKARPAPRVGTFQSFEELEVYKQARAFRKSMYAVNRALPNFEKFDRGSQIRRAAVSLTNNIAEGHGRFHYPDPIRFILHSRGSLEELVDDLNVCLDENYLAEREVAKLKDQALRVLGLINGYLRYLRGRASVVREIPTDDGDELFSAIDSEQL